MNFLFKLGPSKVFGITFIVISLTLFLFPINLFPGIIELGNQKILHEAPLSLSYFIGMGYDPADLKALNVTNFYLTAQGYILAFIFVLGIPGLLAYGSFVYRK
ncbi:MAG: hypothetical protein RLZ10_1619 [Bacteroidota bacterium]|jgi:hypothetical protein